jgi:putative acetyltransferase
MEIREASASDINDVLFIEREAFGHDKEAGLVNDLLNDSTAKPILSLLAFKNDQPVGHILLRSMGLIPRRLRRL